MRRKAARILEAEYNGIRDIMMKTNVSVPSMSKLTGWSTGLIWCIGKWTWEEYKVYKAKYNKVYREKYSQKPQVNSETKEATTYPVETEVVNPNFHTDLGEISKAILFLAEETEKQTKVLMSMNNFLTAVTTEKKRKLFGL